MLSCPSACLLPKVNRMCKLTTHLSFPSPLCLLRSFPWFSSLHAESRIYAHTTETLNYHICLRAFPLPPTLELYTGSCISPPQKNGMQISIGKGRWTPFTKRKKNQLSIFSPPPFFSRNLKQKPLIPPSRLKATTQPPPAFFNRAATNLGVGKGEKWTRGGALQVHVIQWSKNGRYKQILMVGVPECSLPTVRDGATVLLEFPRLACF